MPDLVFTLKDRPEKFSPEGYPYGSKIFNLVEGVLLGKLNHPSCIYLNSDRVSEQHARIFGFNFQGIRQLRIKNISRCKKLVIYRGRRKFVLCNSDEETLQNGDIVALGGYKIKVRINPNFLICGLNRVLIDFGSTVQSGSSALAAGPTEGSSTEDDKFSSGVFLPRRNEDIQEYDNEDISYPTQETEDF